MSEVKEQALSLIQQKLTLLAGHGYTTSKPKLTQFSFEVTIGKEKDKFKLLSYFGKKGVKLYLQGNQNSVHYKTASDLIFGEKLFVQAPAGEPDEYIGIDESGKGDFFGPLVVCGVVVDKNTRNELSKLNVVDSKLLSNSEALKVGNSIYKSLADKFEIIQINPLKYNELYEKFKNLNRLLAWGHAKVIENLLHRHKVKVAISDKFGNEKTLLHSLQNLGQQIEIRQETKAEKYLAVAAASILARARFLSWFEQINSTHKIKLNHGASLDVQRYFLELQRSKPEIIPAIAKLHFKVSEKLR